MLLNIIIALVLLWICIYTFSFAIWTWRQKNRFGGFMLMVIALIAVALPVLNFFIM